MTLAHWLRSAFAARPAARPRPPVRRLTVERLEDRLTPSTGGLLDPTFGSGGQVLSSFTNNYDAAKAVTVQPDGKIVIAGLTQALVSKTGNDFLVARYNADGSVDSSFGGGGHTTTDFGSSSDTALAVALQPQAGGAPKIVVSGLTRSSKGEDEFAVARYNANGTLDATFGSKGKVVTDLGGSVTFAESMVVDSAGRILVAGYTNASGSTTAVLARYTANGALDTTFGSGGKLVTNLSVKNQPIAVALQGDGKIVLAATALDPTTGTTEFVTARFNANGTADAAFGTGGSVATHVGSFDNLGGVAIDGSGRIAVAGMESGLDPDGVDRQGEYLLRYNPDGTLDSGFGSGGVVYLVNPSGWLGENAAGVAVQANGQIVAGGQFDDSAGQQAYFVAMRVSATGALDTGYGSGGWASTHLGYGATATAVAMALQPDGGLLLAGYARPTANTHPTDMAMARFLGSAPQIGAFTASPNPVTAGGNVTLTASGVTDGNPNAAITQAAFYVDSNGDGVLDSGDTLLGYGTQSNGVWTYTFSTTGWASGTYTLFAQAQDNDGALGDPFALTLTVQ